MSEVVIPAELATDPGLRRNEPWSAAPAATGGRVGFPARHPYLAPLGDAVADRGADFRIFSSAGGGGWSGAAGCKNNVTGGARSVGAIQLASSPAREPSPMTSIRIRPAALFLVIAASIVPAATTACSATRGASGASAEPGDALVFSRLRVGSVYGVGSRFSSDGMDFHVESFGADNGNAAIGGPIGSDGASGESRACSLRLSYAALRIQGVEPVAMEFEYFDRGGPVAIEAGGERRGVDDFIALNGATLGRLRIAVSESNTAGVLHGRLRIEGAVDGAIEGLCLSGADLELTSIRLR